MIHQKVTIIEDDPDLSRLLSRFLQADYSVSVYASGEEFIKAGSADADLYIIDINLGGVSGIEVCEQIKKNPITRHRPIIIISAHPEVEALAMEACADDFMTKPFSQKSLTEKILRHLQQ